MTKSRRHYTAEQKAEVVRRHLAAKQAVSDIADDLNLQPSQIHLWVKQVLEQADRAFQRPANGKMRTTDVKDREMAQLRSKLNSKNEVIAELIEVILRPTEGTLPDSEIGTKAINLRGTMPRSNRHDVAPSH